jgi:hypothetical protein
MKKMIDVNDIMDFESGNMSEEEIIRMVAGGIKDGSIWQLQGMYGRLANQLIEDGIVDTEGNIL